MKVPTIAAALAAAHAASAHTIFTQLNGNRECERAHLVASLTR